MSYFSDLYEFLTIIPTLTPVIQVVVLCLTGIFCLVSAASRFFPELGGMIWNRDFLESGVHLVIFTILPALLFAAVTTQVVLAWDSSRPFWGDWRPLSLAVSSLLVAAGIGLFGYAVYLKERSYDLSLGRQIVLALAAAGLFALGVLAGAAL